MLFLKRAFLLLMFLLALATFLFGQRRVDSRHLHERILCVVPMVGTGTYEDPRRPAFAPTAADSSDQANDEKILAYSYQVSDDGQFALVEFVARDRKVFKEIFAARNQGIKVFEKGLNSRAEILAEFRKYKRDFNLESLGVRLP
jgi:hypothetical protein